VGAVVISASPAFAASTLGQMASAFSTDILDFGTVLKVVCYLAGVGFGVSAALKLKEWGSNPGHSQVKPVTPMIFALCAVALLSLPTILNATSQSVTQSAVSITGADASRFQVQ